MTTTGASNTEEVFTTIDNDLTAQEIADALWLTARGRVIQPLATLLSRESRHHTSALPAELAPALHRLRRMTQAPGAPVLDRNATAACLARGIRLPMLRSARERWLDLALVIDASPSMAIWRDAVDDLRATLTLARAFRHLRAWWLDTDTPTGEPFLLRNQELPHRSVAHSPWELLDPTMRRIILVASDCLGAAWHDQRVARLLERWSQAGHVSVVQMFPQRMWRRCGPAVASVQIRAGRPAVGEPLLRRPLPAYRRAWPRLSSRLRRTAFGFGRRCHPDAEIR